MRPLQGGRLNKKPPAEITQREANTRYTESVGGLFLLRFLLRGAASPLGRFLYLFNHHRYMETSTQATRMATLQGTHTTTDIHATQLSNCFHICTISVTKAMFFLCYPLLFFFLENDIVEKER